MTTTITPDEWAQWRKIARDNWNFFDFRDGCVFNPNGAALSRLLDALESANHTISTLRRDLELAKKGLELAERLRRERDWLAGRLGAESCCWRYTDKSFCPDPLLRRECKRCWTFGAAQEATKGVNDNG